MRLKNILFGTAVFCAVLCIPVSTAASGHNGKSRVYDYYDVLSEEEEAALDQELEEIYELYSFDAVILTSRDVNKDERMYAAEFMQENQIGYGESRDGMCLFHQPDCRNIAVVFRGEAQYAFDTAIQDILLDDCTEYLKEDEPYKAYQAVIEDLTGGLKRYSAGKSIRPMDLSSEGILFFALKWLVLSFAVMSIPTLLLTLYQRGRMKTFVQQPNADAYIQKGGVHLDVKRDIYVRTDRVRTKKPEDNHPSGGGGSSGSFTSGGESFSGSSRSY